MGIGVGLKSQSRTLDPDPTGHSVTKRQKPLPRLTYCLLRPSAGLIRSEVLAAVITNVAAFCDIAPCSPYVNLRPSETSVHIQTAWLYIPQDDNLFDGLSSWPEFLYSDMSSDSFDTGWEVRAVCP
jgi:hypothetical protein